MKKSNWQAILGISALGICLICCLGVGLTIRFAPNIYQYYLESSSLRVGDIAPDFALKTLTGKTAHLSDFKGKPVLLSFGATWCPDCRLGAPLVEKAHKAHPELVVLWIDIKEDEDVVQKFADEIGITHFILLDTDGSVTTQYQVFAIPTELFIDGDGVIRAKTVESVTTELLEQKLFLIGIAQ
jgi:peroxiredoxin